MLPQIAQRPQPGNPRLAGEIQFRGVLNAQRHRLAPQPLDGAPGMHLQDFAPFHRRVVQ
jgi:hypothetical protein